MTGIEQPARRYDYIADGPAIYVESFATIRREARLDLVPADNEKRGVLRDHRGPQLAHARDTALPRSRPPESGSRYRGAWRRWDRDPCRSDRRRRARP